MMVCFFIRDDDEDDGNDELTGLLINSCLQSYACVSVRNLIVLCISQLLSLLHIIHTYLIIPRRLILETWHVEEFYQL